MKKPLRLYMFCFVFVLFIFVLFASLLFYLCTVSYFCNCVFVFAGELKFRKEKRVKKPLQIACNGQYYQSVNVTKMNMMLMTRMMKMRMRMWLI